jgi:hypothetical protein
MLRVALNAAAVAGLKATYTEQLAAGARVAAHVLSASKSVGLVPVRVIDVSVNVAVPEFVRVTACASDVVPCAVVGKAMLVVESFTEGAAVPVPVSVTFCGEPEALSVMLNVPVSAAADAGSKAMNTEQDAPAASVAPQLFNSGKDVALVPPIAIEVIVTLTVPVFLSVTVWASLVTPTIVAGKAIVAGVRVTVGVVAATAVPVKATA